jgi:hypothetical protein
MGALPAIVLRRVVETLRKICEGNGKEVKAKFIDRQMAVANMHFPNWKLKN